MAGETTALSAADTAASIHSGRKLSDAAATIGKAMTAAIGTSQLETNDVTELGYVPAGVTVVGFHLEATDMDTGGSPALLMKLTLGSTDLVTGIADGKAGGSSFYACVATTTTAPTLLKVTMTTAAATAAAGTLKVRPIYFAS